MRKLIIINIFLHCFVQVILSQSSPVTFGVASRAELETELLPHEKGAEAVVLCDYATAELVDKNGISLEVKRHVRIKIFKPAGYEYANVMIHYTSDDQLTGLKAVTYNLENGQPVTTPVSKKQMYTESSESYYFTKRFTFPKVREGSVIEYEYTLLLSDILQFYPFAFQRSIPVRYLEYNTSIPEVFVYSANVTRIEQITVSQETRKGYINNQTAGFNITKWTGSNIPAYQAEPYMPESDEYFPGIRYSLTRVNITDIPDMDIAPSYKKLSERLLENTDFSRQSSNTLLFSGKVREIIKGKITGMEQLQAIYDHVKEYMKWNGSNDMLPGESITKAYRDKTGSSADINTILINMIRTAGLTADPVILSTRDNGTINRAVAIASRLNYMVCITEIDGKEYLLDATEKTLPLGMLPYRCLNNIGWVLSISRGRWVNLLNNEEKGIKEIYDLYIEEGGKISGTATVSFIGFTASAIRNRIRSIGEEGFQKEDLVSTGNMIFSNLKVTNMDLLEQPLIVTFDITLDQRIQSASNLSFFEPFFDLFEIINKTWTKNERTFPVDFGCPTNSELTFVYHLPDTYILEELPKNINVVLPDKEGVFKYNAAVNANIVTINSSLNLKKTWFEAGEYPTLKEFITLVNQKNNEMVILRAINTL